MTIDKFTRFIILTFFIIFFGGCRGHVSPEPITDPFNGLNILFQSGLGGGSIDLFVMKQDGTGITKITDEGFHHRSGEWSPDGSKIAFTTADGNDICIINSNGSGEINITNTPAIREYFPSWSPDGTRIIFISDRDPVYVGSGDIFIMNSDGSGLIRLTTGLVAGGNLSWSPDGSKVAFSAGFESGSIDEIYTMNSDGSNITRLTNNGNHDLYPAWSPDGSRILYSDFNDICIMNTDGSNKATLTNNTNGSAYYSCWSPDGTKIVYQQTVNSSFKIFVMNSDGSGKVNITPNGFDNEYPRWR